MVILPKYQTQNNYKPKILKVKNNQNLNFSRKPSLKNSGRPRSKNYEI